MSRKKEQEILSQIGERAQELGRDLTIEEQAAVWEENGLCFDCGHSIGCGWWPERGRDCENCREYSMDQTAEMKIDIASGK
jgi:hypothetical protein